MQRCMLRADGIGILLINAFASVIRVRVIDTWFLLVSHSSRY